MAVVVFVVACGDETDTAPSGGVGASAASGGVGGAGGTGTAVGGTGGAGGSTGDGNDSLATATPITLGDVVDASIDPVASDVDFYVFSVDAPLFVGIHASALPAGTHTSRAYVDTALTLYDETETQLAFNDDMFPPASTDSLVVTRLPMAGTYYLRVEHVCASSAATGCAPDWAESVTDTGYTLTSMVFDDAEAGFVQEQEPNDVASDARAGEFVDGRINFLYGMFEEGDVDVYTVTPPSDLYDGMLPGLWVAHYFSGPDNHGSTTPVGLLWLEDASTQEVIARADLVSIGQSVMPPIEPGHTYNLYVAPPEGAVGGNAFYVLFNLPWGLGPIEQDEVGNDTTPEVLVSLASELVPDGVIASWMVTGHIVASGSDIDRFAIDLPESMPASAMVAVECFGERRGSGLRSMHVALLRGTDDTLLDEDTESGTHTARLGPVAPTGETSVVLEVSAASQAADNPATYYSCTVSLAEGS